MTLLAVAATELGWNFMNDYGILRVGMWQYQKYVSLKNDESLWFVIINALIQKN